MAGWHPAVWWIDRRLHIEREIACDEITVTMTDSPKSYAECLLKLASLRGPARTVQAAPAVFTPSSLRARVTKIISRRRWMTPVWSDARRSNGIDAERHVCKRRWAEADRVDGIRAAIRVGVRADGQRHPGDDPTGRGATSLQTCRKHTFSASVRASKPSAQHPTAKRPSSSPSPSPSSLPSSLPVPEPETPRTPAAVNAPETSPAAAQNGDDQSGTSKMSTVLNVPEKQPSEVTTEHPQSPWTAAADGGSAIGRKSKDAGVATAGFFTRFGRRVAGSF